MYWVECWEDESNISIIFEDVKLYISIDIKRLTSYYIFFSPYTFKYNQILNFIILANVH